MEGAELVIDAQTLTTSAAKPVTAVCRACEAPLQTTFVDLGSAPPSNAYLRPEQLGQAETYFPLHAYVCDACFLVQLEAFQEPAEIFTDYAYFSSFSDSWLEHGRRFVEVMYEQPGFDAKSVVLEIASNDGYLLRRFAARGNPVIGIEPAQNVARVAVAAGVPTITSFFGETCARGLRAEHYSPRLVIANNVLAHVPDLHDFVAGIAVLLDDDALATIEVPHVLQLIEGCQFDTIYHEHFSYFSLLALEPVFRRHGLMVSDVDQLPTHGGSLRLHLRRIGATVASRRVPAIREREHRAGLGDLQTYRAFAQRVTVTKRRALEFLLRLQGDGAVAAAYGAPAKGNTFLAYCGIRSDLIEFTVDRSPHKQGLFLPGSRIPILAPAALFERKPDYVLILPWNLADEVMDQMREIRDWGGRFVTAIPELVIHS